MSNTGTTTLAEPGTPFAVVDVTRAERNSARLRERVDAHGVALRPHVKTAKTVEAALLMHGGERGPITVSTLAEAEGFAQSDFTDITYAVGLAPHKLPRIIRLVERGVRLTVLLDSTPQAQAVAAAAAERGVPIPALIEVDCDGHRGGLLPEQPALLEVGRILHEAGCLAGVLSHAGESYFAVTPEAKEAAAESERAVTVAAAERLRGAGYPAATVSVGSTPTAHFARDLTGVTEVRAGNYVFFDLVMAGIDVCSVEDLALSVVVTVIGHRPEKGWILTDGGWMATSRDRGTAAQQVDQGYGLVTDLQGKLIPGLVMTDASQEHGILTVRDGHQLPELPGGTRLRILPNHACATAAQHRDYAVISPESSPSAAPEIRETWHRIQGW